MRRFEKNLGGGCDKMIQTLQIKTTQRTELIEITHGVQDAVKKTGIENGLCIIFVPHTTAAITINEHADPSVSRDILMELNKMVPMNDHYQHLEGNSPAHIKSSLLGCSQMVPVEKGRLTLGTWQGIFFCEFDGPRSRKVHVKVISEER